MLLTIFFILAVIAVLFAFSPSPAMRREHSDDFWRFVRWKMIGKTHKRAMA